MPYRFVARSATNEVFSFAYEIRFSFCVLTDRGCLCHQQIAGLSKRNVSSLGLSERMGDVKIAVRMYKQGDKNDTKWKKGKEGTEKKIATSRLACHVLRNRDEPLPAVQQQKPGAHLFQSLFRQLKHVGLDVARHRLLVAGSKSTCTTRNRVSTIPHNNTSSAKIFRQKSRYVRSKSSSHCMQLSSES